MTDVGRITHRPEMHRGTDDLPFDADDVPFDPSATATPLVSTNLQTAVVELEAIVVGISLGAVPTFVWNETPGGTVNGSNAAFTLAGGPSPSNSLLLFKNGMLQRAGSGNDFTLSGSTVTFEAGNIPATGDVLLASYTT